MEDLLVRSLLAVPVAMLLPLGLPRVPPAWLRSAIAGVLVLAAVAACLDRWQAVAIVVVAAALAAAPVEDRNRPWWLAAATSSSPSGSGSPSGRSSA